MFYGIISNEKQHKQYLLKIESLMEKDNLNEQDKAVLDLLSRLVEWYEEEKGWDMDRPEPLRLIKIRMNDLGLKEKDLIGILGSKGHVSRILNGKRRLTVENIMRLADQLKVSPGDLMPKSGSPRPPIKPARKKKQKVS